MFGQIFLASKVGLAALASIAAMVAFNIFALAQQSAAKPDMLLVATSMVGLA